MKTYLFIQYKRFCRISFEKRVHPLFSLIFLIFLFVSLSSLIFTKVKYPAFSYSFIGIVLMIFLSNSKRITFLKHSFSSKEFYKIRLVENGVLAIPFISFLLYKGQPLLSLFVATIALTLVIIPFSIKSSLTIPTPFGKYPFEFSRGFRRLLILIIVTYILTFFAIRANNFNLSVFILLISFLITSSYYTFIEPVYYIWIHNQNSTRFIRKKITHIIAFTLIPSLPILISIFAFFPSYYWILILGILIGLSYTLLLMLVKYANYPYDVPFKNSVIIFICIIFPPFNIISIPYFYYSSIQNLNKILYD